MQANTPAVVSIETLTVRPSAFIAREVAKFTRSNTRIYAALIVDVAQAHAGVRPKGYPEMLAEMAPECSVDWKQYCTIIAPALRSPVHGSKVREFAATASGLDSCVAWLEDTARASGYTLALRDLINFFNGKPSIKRAAEMQEDESAKIIAQGMAGKTPEEIKRSEQAVIAAAAQQVSNLLSNVERKVDQHNASLDAQDVPHAVTDVQPLPRGPVIDGGYESTVLCVHAKGNIVKVTGADGLSEEVLQAAIVALQMQLDAMREAVAENSPSSEFAETVQALRDSVAASVAEQIARPKGETVAA